MVVILLILLILILEEYSESREETTSEPDVMVKQVMSRIDTELEEESIEYDEDICTTRITEDADLLEPDPYDEPEVEEVKAKEVNSNDANMLAHTINGEAGAKYCNDIMRYYVGSVVLNRVSHPEFPNTIYEVIHQPGQYACVTDGHYDLKPDSNCYEIAYSLLRYGSKLPGNVVYQSNYEQGSGVYAKVQNMYFCCR